MAQSSSLYPSEEERTNTFMWCTLQSLVGFEGLPTRKQKIPLVRLKTSPIGLPVSLSEFPCNEISEAWTLYGLNAMWCVNFPLGLEHRVAGLWTLNLPEQKRVHQGGFGAKADIFARQFEGAGT